MNSVNTHLKELFTNLPYGAKIVPKTGWFWKLINIIIIILSRGKNRRFLTDYVTTIGNRIAVPPEKFKTLPPLEALALLEHELVHVKQAKAYGLGNIYLGTVIWGALWLLAPIPSGLAYFRYKFEREAYLKQAQVRILHMGHEDTIEWIEWVVKELSGPSYIWAWPFPNKIREWFKNKLIN